MRLLTHNLLQCNKKGVKNGFPLTILPVAVKYEESPYDKDFTSAMVPKLQYDALLKALNEIRSCPQLAGNEALMGGIPVLPLALPADPESNEDFLKKLHVVIFDLHLVEGKLVCPESGREFPVNDSIPNMLLNDDEV
mmetsp:Transcript_19334/g.30866  ORF Transcript_19334/g.30866 Transcript_19334/m.30866 type:complete len:137 (-) Transcript_19334:65-475(-)|eukprot:CAMPEP_0115092190 /NCGR_PEP_ID=MMETSP0227-20121206/26599_1 /TAXON_ID=89957 /ORGANISM="Polarella glacialis, Strain CCMP 1383" /LENGTH=136 /DNA_ID=CAMNT_0002483923 /DNA_START=68 /DNA_END=478 /DNA_ORIENTATION=-